MLKIIPDEVPEITPDTTFDPDPSFGAKGGKLDELEGKNAFVTLLTGKFLVGRVEKVGNTGAFTVGNSEPIGNAIVETVREV